MELRNVSALNNWGIEILTVQNRRKRKHGRFAIEGAIEGIGDIPTKFYVLSLIFADGHMRRSSLR